MGGRDVNSQGFGSVFVDAQQALGMILRVGVHVAAEHPHPADDTNPRLAGQLIGQDPVIAAGVLELLSALGLPTTAAGRRALQARARIEQARRTKHQEQEQQ
jgi:hypothetical protein